MWRLRLLDVATWQNRPWEHQGSRVTGGGETRARDVLAVLRMAAEADARVWVDGGWGVDALLGRQTRPHADLDLAVEADALARFVSRLEAAGYRPRASDADTPWNFVLVHPGGSAVDLHVIRFDGQGRGVMHEIGDGAFYPAGSLTGRGSIDGVDVDCVEPSWLVRFHTGYSLDADDWADVLAICDEFGLPVPADYAEFEKRGGRKP